jgi:hypothetical protein
MGNNKGKQRREEKQWRRQREAQRQNDVIQHTAAILTCAAQTAGELTEVCAHATEELVVELPFSHLALELWRAQPQAPPALLAAIQSLLAEQLRHQEALQRIAQQLRTLADDPSFHIHLGSPETYRELVRSRLFPTPPAL